MEYLEATEFRPDYELRVAAAEGRFEEEIFPLEVKRRDGETLMKRL